MTASRALRLFVRVSLGGLLLAMTAIAVLASCDSSEGPAAIDVGSGGTYGAEISLRVTGRGRVTSTPPSIDCPSDCFARIVLPSAAVDGGDGGVTLIAEDTPGSHFVGWSFDEVDLGARARGPAACSPMTRKASAPPDVDLATTVVSLPFGETQGTPPLGHEAECAAFTSVSLAYAVTAKFADDPPEPRFDAWPPDPADQEVLFFPLVQPSQAKEIGVASGYAYWRYEVNGLSGIAGGFVASGAARVIVPANQVIRAFDVDRHAVFQYGDGSLWVIPGGAMTTTPLGQAPFCLALASDAQNVYCRAATPDGGTAIYAWPAMPSPFAADAGAPSIVHVLPPGRGLAVDTARFYFSEDQGGAAGQAEVLSVTRTADVDGGTSPFTALAFGQTSPFALSVGPTYLAWIDGMGGSQAAVSTAKTPPSSPVTGLGGTAIRLIAADPVTNDYFVGVGDDGSGSGFQIYRITGGMTGLSFFRNGTSDLGGLAVDATYVYWTRPNGRVYRAFKHDLGGP